MTEHRKHRESNIVIGVTVNHPATFPLVKCSQRPNRSLQYLVSHGYTEELSGMVLTVCFVHIWFHVAIQSKTEELSSRGVSTTRIHHSKTRDQRGDVTQKFLGMN